MKRFLTCFILLAAALCTFAQSPAKNDVVLKLNGDELTGKVLQINDSDIEFAYAGETLVYHIKKSEIMKITYGSGRVEVFNKQPQPEQAKVAPGGEDHHNKVAILPFTFLNDGQAMNDAISEQVQNECYAYMSKHAGVLAILDPRNTNVILVRAGITRDNIKGYTMEDLCGMLGVEYLVSGTVSMNKANQTTYQSNSGSSKDKDGKDRTYNNSSYGSATQNYQTKLTLGIYNDKGASVYNQERSSFWNTQDAYKLTLEYLLKRSPLYAK